MPVSSHLSPADLGLPPKFSSFRPAQEEALEYIAGSAKRFTALGCPTGSGKSALAVAAAKLLGLRAVYLTATKGLQDQVAKEFAKCGLVDVRGRNNFHCAAFGNCDQGAQEDCDALSCPYTAAVEKAKASQLIVTNYSYWLHARGNNAAALEYNDRPVELLICDEAHEAPEQLASYLRVEVPINVIDSKGRMPHEGHIAVAEQKVKRIAEMQIDLDRRDDAWKELDEEKQRWQRITKMDDNWVWQASHGRVRFDVIWPGQYAKALWSGVDRVLLMSATLRPYTLSLLGLSKDTYDFREWPAVFQPSRSPVYHIPTAKLTWKATDNDYKEIIERADAIIDGRLDRNGIIHTVSYARSRRALQYSRHHSRFIWNENGQNLSAALGQFRKSHAGGAVLITPSVKAGYDFPLRECEYQIILKTPFPDTSSAVEAARCEVNDGDYRMYVAMQDLVQMCGRAMRSADDRSETFILDNGVSWLLARGKKFAPGWFKVWTVQQIPPAPPKL